MTATARADGPELDVVIVGAGFAGLYMLHRARLDGLRAVVLEKGGDVGGTWYWNRYPGARCDIPSIEYSYSFSAELQDEWEWSERYASQPEIEKYAQHVARRFDLYRDIAFGEEVRAAIFDDDAGVWQVTTAKGTSRTARYCVLCTGGLSAPVLPSYPGAGRFRGQVLQTAAWPAEGADVAGRRVGVIGTGSSGVQLITDIARSVASLTVFQRTPNFSVPNQNRPLAPGELDDARRRYPSIRARARASRSGLAADPPTAKAMQASASERQQVFAEQWRRGGPAFLGTFTDLLVDPEANEAAAEFVRQRIREIVTDPAVAERLTPRSHPIGAKRLCLDAGYYEVYNRDNVELVDLRATPIVRVEAGGPVTTERAFDLDVLVLATGFDAVTGAVSRIDVRGTDGMALAEEWSEGPATYLGLMAAHFPNLFLVGGPGSPSVFGNVIVSIEQHVEWISTCLGWLRQRGLRRIAASSAAQKDWTEHVQDVAAATLFAQADSWYRGANVPGKARMILPYLGGTGPYRRACDEIAGRDYEGFEVSA